MLTIRLTKKLQDRLKLKPESEPGITAQVKIEIAAMRQGHIAKTASRSVLGSLKDFAFLMEAWWEHEQSLLSMSLRLAGVPCRPLKEGFPDQAVREAFQKPGGHLRLAQ